LVLAAAAPALLIAGSWFLFPSQGTPRILLLEGSNQLRRTGQNIAAREGMLIEPGDFIETGPTGRVVVSFEGELTSLELKPTSQLELSSWNGGKRLVLSQGTIDATVARQRPFRPLIITTPNAAATVIGTRFTLTATTNRTQLEVDEGKVRLADTLAADTAPVVVSAGNYTVVAPGTVLAALPQTGSIYREYWTNLPGRDVDLDLMIQSVFPDHPTGHDWLGRFETPNGWGDDYGACFRGFLHPPASGNYRIALDARDDAILYLSQDANPENKAQVGRSGHTDRDALTSNSPAFSFEFQAGRYYYIEVIHKAGKGSDHLSVSWKRPDGRIEIISGEYLSPFKLKPKQKRNEKVFQI
jgi:hypothetical protein